MPVSRTQFLRTPEELREGFRTALQGLTFLDTHVHDMPLCMGEGFAIQGLVQATAYHYLEGECALRRHMTREEITKFRAMSADGRADLIAEALSSRGELMISTAANGLYRIAGALGLEPNQSLRELLAEWRSRYGRMPPEEYRDMVFGRSCVHGMVSTQSIFLSGEARLYLDDGVLNRWDRRYEVGVRCDELLRKPEEVTNVLKLVPEFAAAAGDFNSPLTKQALCDLIEHFITRFGKVTKVRYLSASLGPEDRFYEGKGQPGTSRFAVLMREVLLKIAVKLKLPIFLMPYVQRGLNPVAGPTGDCVAHGDIDDLKQFVADNHHVGFIISGLHPSLNYDLCFLARACPNVRIIGFWWGNLNSVRVREQIEERLEFVGLGTTGLNSDARITDQILYKFPDYFHDLEEVLVTKRFPQMVAAGNPVTVDGIAATIKALQDENELFWFPG